MRVIQLCLSLVLLLGFTSVAKAKDLVQIEIAAYCPTAALAKKRAKLAHEVIRKNALSSMSRDDQIDSAIDVFLMSGCRFDENLQPEDSAYMWAEKPLVHYATRFADYDAYIRAITVRKKLSDGKMHTVHVFFLAVNGDKKAREDARKGQKA